MQQHEGAVVRGLIALRRALADLLAAEPVLTGPLPTARRPAAVARRGPLLNEAVPRSADSYGDAARAASSEDDSAEASRLIALVELARGGDSEAFGLLYDHYQPVVHRFLFYRTRSVVLAEDLTSETFLRALRGMDGFRWQGKDFGAWLMTIARNLATDHFKAGRTRLELTTEDMAPHDSATEGPEAAVLASLTSETLLRAVGALPEEQRDCLVMRFLQGMSIAETAAVLDRSDGAVKQLQLRGVRNLAKALPPGWRP